MAESTLSYNWDDFKQEVGRFLGYGSDSSSWSSDQTAVIEMCVHSGCRNVMFPPAMEGIQLGYSWSWMRPTTTIDTTADQGEDDMPDDFHRLIGSFHFESAKGYAKVKQVVEGEILELRALDDYNGFPRLCAFRYKSTDQTTGQRQEVIWYPEPDDTYTLTYSYEVYQGKLSDSAKYPPGGMHMSEVYMESCLAVAEQRILDQQGIHTVNFNSMLVAAVARDKQRGGKNYGRVGHKESTLREVFRGQRGGTYNLTYNGDTL